jgi:hypothetical protein
MFGDQYHAGFVEIIEHQRLLSRSGYGRVFRECAYRRGRSGKSGN